MRRWILAELALTALVFVVAQRGLGYPWQLALLTAGAVGALAYSTRRTYLNLRQIYLRPGWLDDADDEARDQDDG